MGSRIEIDTGRLNQTIQDMTDLLGQVKSQSDGIYGDVTELDAMWDGSANSAFNRQFLSDRARLAEICQDLEGHIQRMGTAKEEYDNCENAVAELVNAI
jgi:WXG100 family type VII secretion target